MRSGPQPVLVGDEHARHPAAAELLLEREAVAESLLQLVAELGHLRMSSG